MKLNDQLNKIFMLNFKLSLLVVLATGLVFTGGCQKKTTNDSTVRLVLNETPKSLDPAVSSDQVAAEVIGSLYETLYQYSYFKRPYQLEPALAEGMPTFSKDEKTLIVKIKKGSFFVDDPCFENGKGREVSVEDIIFAIKRVADPAVQSDGFWTVDKKILGINDWQNNAQSWISENQKAGVAFAAGSLPPYYQDPILGLKALDKYTLQIKLTQKYPQIVYVLGMLYTVAVPIEAVKKYGVEIQNHPVGSGPFRLVEFVRDSKIILEKNTNYRAEVFSQPDISAPQEAQGMTEDIGKKLPLADRIEVSLVVENQPRWLKLLKGEVDRGVIPKDNYDQAVGVDGNLRPELTKQGFSLSKADSTTTWWLGFNMLDPFLGKHKLVRQAIAYAYDARRDLELFMNGRGVLTNQILPRSVMGYDESVPSREVNLEKAKELLKKAGFSGGKGIPTLKIDVQSSTQERQHGEYVKSQLAQIGINSTVVANSRPELLEKKRRGTMQIHIDGWIADYPDAENFLQLLYGPNSAPGPNNSSFKNTEYDELYKKIALMREGPERNKIVARMTAIVLDEQPWVPCYTTRIYNLIGPRLKNFVYSDFSYNWYKYLRVENK